MSKYLILKQYIQNIYYESYDELNVISQHVLDLDTEKAQVISEYFRSHGNTLFLVELLPSIDISETLLKAEIWYKNPIEELRATQEKKLQREKAKREAKLLSLRKQLEELEAS